MRTVSRRSFLRHGWMSLLMLSSPLRKAFPEESCPILKKKVEKAFKAPGPQPNGLQAVADGLWILDQRSNKVYKVRYEDGSVLVELDTESDRGSGITYGDGALWVASTYNCKILRIDPKTGKTLASFHTPGSGRIRWRQAAQDTGAHGMEWVDGKLWVAVPPAEKIYQLDPKDCSVLHQIPAPGMRPHGLGWDGSHLWCAETNHRAFYELDPKDGRILAKIQLAETDPEPHGMTFWRNVFWYCDAESGWVCRVT